MVCSMAMPFLTCTDNYKRVGEEAQKKIYPRWIAENSELTYSELNEPLEGEDIKNAKNIAILRSPITYNYENLLFPYRLFPNGIEVDFFDENGEKNKVRADYAIIYSATNLIDLQGNVVLETPDGKKLETSQLFYDQDNQWIFTQKVFKFTNPKHIQEPMIASVVSYFLGISENPCTTDEGIIVMKAMEKLSGRQQ